MSTPRLIVKVLPDGTVEANTEGVTGSACLDYISVLEDLIAGETVSSQFTDDYHRTPSQVGAAVHDAVTQQVRSQS